MNLFGLCLNISMGEVSFIRVCEMKRKGVCLCACMQIVWISQVQTIALFSHLVPNLPASFMLCCKAISVCMHAVHPVNTFVWNAAPCLVFVCHFTNYLELRALAQPKPRSVNTLAPLLGGCMLVGCAKTWQVKAAPINTLQRWLSTNTDYSDTNFHTNVLYPYM